MKLQLKKVTVNKEEPLKNTFGLVYGLSGTGKTTMATTYPNSAFIALEKNTKEFEGISEIPVDGTYSNFVETLEAIIETPEALEGIEYIIIDSITALDNLIVQELCYEYGIDDINENIKGAKVGIQHSRRSGMFTKVMTLLQEITNSTPFGVVATAHAKEVYDNKKTVPEVIGIDINLPAKYKDMLKQRLDYGINIENGVYDSITSRTKVKGPHINFQPVGSTDSFNLIRKLGNSVLEDGNGKKINRFDPTFDVLELYIKQTLEQNKVK